MGGPGYPTRGDRPYHRTVGDLRDMVAHAGSTLATKLEDSGIRLPRTRGSTLRQAEDRRLATHTRGSTPGMPCLQAPTVATPHAGIDPCLDPDVDAPPATPHAGIDRLIELDLRLPRNATTSSGLGRTGYPAHAGIDR